MSQSNFNAAFADVVAGSSPAPVAMPRDLVEQLMRRDQRRTHLLAAASLVCWLLGAAGMILLIVGLNRFIIGVRIAHLMPMNTTAGSGGERFVLAETDLLHHSMPYLAASVVALLMAALFTVLLVFTSRQATLNRINISLAYIAQQMRDPAGSPISAPDFALRRPLPRRSRILIWIGTALFATAIAGSIFALVRHSGTVRSSTGWQGYARLSPFEAIRWTQQVPQVRVHGTWYELQAVNDVTVEQIIAFSHSQRDPSWKKHFNEDLVQLLMEMGHTPGESVDLAVKDLGSGETRVLKDVQMTAQNRSAILEFDLDHPVDVQD